MTSIGHPPAAAEVRFAPLRLLCLILSLATLVVYLPVRHHPFVVYDDPDYVTENRTVQAGLSFAGLKWAFTIFHASNWHPLTWLSHMVDCECFGLEPGAHHLVNVLFHAANAGLLLIVLFRLTGAPWTSAFVAALFAWHPLHVESVAWVAERKDVLSTLFWMLSVLAYLRYVQKTGGKLQEPVDGTPKKEQKEKMADGGKASPFYLLALGWFALGLMSKPMLVTLPATLLLLDYWPLRRFSPSGRYSRQAIVQLLVEKWPFLLLTFVSCVVTFVAQREEAVVGLSPYPLSWRLGNAVVSYVRYLIKVFWPVNLAVIYPLPRGWPWLSVVAAASSLALICWLVWRGRQQRPHLLVGWFWFLGTLVPVIGLVQVGGQAMADRYTYIPLIGVFIAVAFEAKFWVERWHVGRLAPAVLAGVALMVSVSLTEHQLRYWTDSRSLFTHAIAVTADNAIAHINLGIALEEAGQRDEAFTHYQEALRLNPDLVQVHNNLGNVLNQLGRTREALEQYEEALRRKPAAPLVHANLAAVLMKLGRLHEAMAHFEEAARRDPGDPRLQYAVAKALLRQGRDVDAVSHFREALRLNPNDIKSLVYLARVLAADADPRVRNGVEAVSLAERANASAGSEQAFVLDTLAIAYAETGRFLEARSTVKRAIERAVGEGDTEAISDMQRRLHLYESGQAYREAFTNIQPELISR